jgi:hypothetical protein
VKLCWLQHCIDIFFFFFFAEDEQFEADKAQIVKEIAALEPRE